MKMKDKKLKRVEMKKKMKDEKLESIQVDVPLMLVCNISSLIH